jgi:effector-binding domain-containing protein
VADIPAEPRIVTRTPQPYISITGRVTMQRIPEIADRMPEVFGWLAQRGIEADGPPFFKYNLIDMERELEIEVGVPVADVLDGDEVVRSGVLPAGRYASIGHVGHPRELVDVTARLLDWAAEQGLSWDTQVTDRGERWGCRLELYKTDPAVEPDMNRWETELAFRLAD